MAFLHGVETIELEAGLRAISVVKSSVIALVGIAPTGPSNELVRCLSETDDAQFGKEVFGFNIPRALKAIRAHGSGLVLVVNIYDEATHSVQINNEAKVVTNGKFTTLYGPLNTPVVTNVAGTTTYVNGTDYEFDAYGNYTILSGSAITEGQTVHVDYKRLDPSTVIAADLVGDDTPGARTGCKLFKEAYTTFGYKPKLIIIPGYSTLSDVAAEMASMASDYRAHYFIDAPASTDPTDAVAGRGPAGTIGFYTSDKRAILCYPMLKADDEQTGGPENRPYSQFLAGLMAAVDNTEGYWVSPSNHEIKGITGVETVLTADIANPNTEVNQLNEVGIVTVFASFGTGYRAWGNRSAKYPSSTDPDNFIAVQRVADVIHDSVEQSMLQFIDRPINQATIDSVRESVNAFLRSLVGRGAIVDGSCIYDPNDNPAQDLANGQVEFRITFMPPTPMERITFNSFIDINLLSSALNPTA